MAESKNDLYTFEDAFKVVCEVEYQLLEERDANGPDSNGLYRDWDRFHTIQSRLEEIHRLRNILEIEPAIDNFIRKYAERNDNG